MRAPTALLLTLFGLAATACRCTPSDGWPHTEDHLWRIVLDPSGAASYSSAPDARPLALLHSGDARGAEALLVGYRGTTRTSLATTEARWDGCAKPSLPSGLRLATPSESPDHPGLAWLGAATQVEMPTPPGNPSETLLMARDRLATLLGPGTGEPVQVRTLVKQRRPAAPPVFVAVGDAGCQGIVAVLDSDGEPLVSELVPLPGPACAPLAAMPPADLDGDGRRELALRAGNGEPGVGVYRAVYRLALDGPTPSLERAWHDQFLARCD